MPPGQLIVLRIPRPHLWLSDDPYLDDLELRFARARDPTRLVDTASGWHERNAGDVVGRHDRVPTAGVYGFRISSDDGIHGMAERSGWVALDAGMHALEVVVFQGCCGVGLRLEVDVPGRGRRALPPGWMWRG